MTSRHSPLSPAEQAVLDAFLKELSPDNQPGGLPAALRAVADQVVPNEKHPGQSQFWDAEADREWQNSQHFRGQLLAIAAELEVKP